MLNKICRKKQKYAQNKLEKICYNDESVQNRLQILCKYDTITYDVGNVTENDSKVQVF